MVGAIDTDPPCKNAITLRYVQHSSDIECLLTQQHTLLWNENKYLEISAGENNKPLSIIYDKHGEEL
jgi:hypothetical protein